MIADVLVAIEASNRAGITRPQRDRVLDWLEGLIDLRFWSSLEFVLEVIGLGKYFLDGVCECHHPNVVVRSGRRHYLAWVAVMRRLSPIFLFWRF